MNPGDIVYRKYINILGTYTKTIGIVVPQAQDAIVPHSVRIRPTEFVNVYFPDCGKFSENVWYHVDHDGLAKIDEPR